MTVDLSRYELARLVLAMENSDHGEPALAQKLRAALDEDARERERKQLVVATWHDIAADALREGKVKEALELIAGQHRANTATEKMAINPIYFAQLESLYMAVDAFIATKPFVHTSPENMPAAALASASLAYAELFTRWGAIGK